MEKDNADRKSIKILSDEEREERALTRKLIKENYKYDKDLSEEHVQFLKDIEQYEESRLLGIETKLSSIIGQSGIIFTLIALFIPLFLNDLNNISLSLKGMYCLLFVVGFVFFVKSILAASSTLKINDFPYARPDINSALAKTIKERSFFIAGLVKDLITTIEINTAANTKKGNNLMIAHRDFVCGILTMGILGLVLTLQTFFYKKQGDPDAIMLKNIVLIQNQIDESRRILNHLIVERKSKLDSIQLLLICKKLDSLSSSLKRIGKPQPRPAKK
jgi:hypothetical protein